MENELEKAIEMMEIKAYLKGLKHATIAMACFAVLIFGAVMLYKIFAG